jgi:hypothetical protein
MVKWIVLNGTISTKHDITCSTSVSHEHVSVSI